MRIVLLGRIGLDDADEDAVARSVARALADQAAGISVAVATFAPGTMQALGVDTVDAGGDTAIGAAIAHADLVAVVGTPWNDADAWRADELFHTASTPAARVARTLVTAAAAGVPSALFAIGIAPLAPERRRLVAFLASLAAHVSVRDDESAAELRAAGFTGALAVTADPTFAVVAETAVVPTAQRKPLRLGILLGASTTSAEASALADTVNALAAREALEVVVIQRHRIEANARLAGSLTLPPDAVLTVDAVASEAIVQWLGACTVVVTTSVHGVILGAVAGTPAVAIGGDPALQRQARALGCADLVVDLTSGSASAVVDAVEQARATRPAIATQLAARLEVARTVLDAAYGALLAVGGNGTAGRDGTRDAALEQVCQRLRSRLEQREESWRTLMTFLGREVETIAPISTGVTQRSRDIEVLRQRAEAAETELAAIKRTRGWQLLHRYGVLKHRYLLPAARYLRRRGRSSGAHGRDARDDGDEPAPVELPPGTFDVVCFPIIDWDFRFQRPQQLMARFAAAGHRVFYVAPRFGAPGEAPVVVRKGPNVYHVTLAGPERNVWTQALDPQARDHLFASLNQLRIHHDLGATLACVQLPFWGPLVTLAREQFAWPILYDCMDDHAGFSTFTGATENDEHALFAGADLVVVSSSLLAERAREHRDDCLLLRNGCEFEHFATAAGPRPSHERPVIGYYGAIADWFDADLVADLAERRPDWDFVLVGSTDTGDVSRLATLPNVRLPGEQPYPEIPKWLATFDVTLLPFKRTPLTEATNPVKAYEILAAGKPLVSVPLPEMRLLGDLVRLAATPLEFEREIVAALDPEDATHVDERQAFARANTWQARYDELAGFVPALFPKASTVIVTFNNLAMNRDCLEHLFARTEWPNHEVIVVDNASTDGTREYLEQLAAERGDLIAIYNDGNLGFAAACNQGLARATGRYLVLLNNDTVVTRGWLSTLIRHLHAMPEIGLIGPVTNEIGNEAKVAVGYTELAALPAWAARFTRENADRLRSMTMLAMFCVAMRRDAFEDVGPLDERFGIGMFEDDDYSRRMHSRGYRVVTASDSFVHHIGGASFKRLDETRYRELFERNRRAYERKWGPWAPHQDDTAVPRVAMLHERLLRIVEQAGLGPSCIVVMLRPMPEPPSHVQDRERIGAALAKNGMLVFLEDANDVNDGRREFQPIERNLWRYRGPRGVLERLENPVLWTLVYNALAAFRWLDATILYDARTDPALFGVDPEVLRVNHERLLREADVVLCGSETGARELATRRPDVVQLPTPDEPAAGTTATKDHDQQAWPEYGRRVAELLSTPRSYRRRTRKLRAPAHAARFVGQDLHRGTCNVCGHSTAFFFTDVAMYRESLLCGDCLTTSRYRSIARGILRAIRELTGIDAASLAELADHRSERKLRVYDTQLAFSFERNAYPIPDLLAACDWIEVHTSTFRAREPLGKVLGNGRSNQNLERLTFPDAYFDLVVTSDVMEHVRLPERAHSEIRRVLGSGGVYLFTVPHFRDPFETMVRVTVVDPDDPSRDAFLMEPEYHGDVNCEDNAALSYRVFGRDIDGTLERLGFRVEYSKDDVADTGIRNTELFYCRVVSSPDTMAADAR